MGPAFLFGLLAGAVIAAVVVARICEREQSAHFKRLLEQLKCR